MIHNGTELFSLLITVALSTMFALYGLLLAFFDEWDFHFGAYVLGIIIGACSVGFFFLLLMPWQLWVAFIPIALLFFEFWNLMGMFEYRPIELVTRRTLWHVAYGAPLGYAAMAGAVYAVYSTYNLPVI